MTTGRANEYEAAIDDALAGDDPHTARRVCGEYRAAAGTDATDPTTSPAVRAAYLSAQADAAAGFLSSALEHLAPVLRHAAAFPAPLARRVWVLAAELHARLGRLPDAAAAVATADQYPSADSLPLRVRLARVSMLTAGIREVELFVRQLAGELDAGGDRHNLAVLLCDEGRAWDAAGEAERATGCWERAVAVLAGEAVSAPKAAAHVGLGRLAHLAGRYQHALDAFATASTAARPGSDLHLEGVLRRLLVRLELNQDATVRREFDAVQKAVGEDVPDELRGVWALLGWLAGGGAVGYAAAQAGDVEQARGEYRRAAEGGAGPTRRARAALALGLLALAAGDRREATDWLTRAEAAAVEHHLPEVLVRARHGLGRVAAELDHDDDTARRLFERATEAAEVQSGRLRSPADAAAYRRSSHSAVRELLRSAGRAADAGRVFRYQELDRGRLLLDLWRAADRTPPELRDRLADLDRRLAAAPDAGRAAALATDRDRLLDQFLLVRERPASASAPPVPELPALQAVLPPGTAYLALSWFPDQLLLLAADRHRAEVLRAPDPEGGVARSLTAVRQRIAADLARYERGFPVDRDGLNAALVAVGNGPLGRLVGDVLDRLGPHVRRVVWVPDGEAHGLPLHAVRVDGTYLIERVEVAYGFGGGLLARQLRTRRPWWAGGRPAVVIDTPDSLPAAESEGAAVAAAVRWCRPVRGGGGTKAAVTAAVRGARVAHFACHAEFDPASPLSAAVRLPAGDLWRAADWPADHPPRLAVLAACRSGEVATAVGREVYGLAAGALVAGVGGVVAGLWPVADREAVPLVAAFYRHLARRDPCGALVAAQREALARHDASPLFWAVFALFGDPATLPPPPWWARWLFHRQVRTGPNGVM